MAEQSVADQVRKERESREERSLRLFKEKGNEIWRIGDDLFRVPSCSSETVYIVDLEHETCPCPDHQRRGVNCKHILSACIVRAKENRECRPCYGSGRVVLEVEGDDGRLIEMSVTCRRCGGRGES